MTGIRRRPSSWHHWTQWSLWLQNARQAAVDSKLAGIQDPDEPALALLIFAQTAYIVVERSSGAELAVTRASRYQQLGDPLVDAVAGLLLERLDQPEVYGKGVCWAGLEHQVGEPLPLSIAGKALGRLPGRVDVAVSDQHIDEDRTVNHARPDGLRTGPSRARPSRARYSRARYSRARPSRSAGTQQADRPLFRGLP